MDQNFTPSQDGDNKKNLLNSFKSIFSKKTGFAVLCLVFLIVVINIRPLFIKIANLVPGSFLANVISSSLVENLGPQFQSLALDGSSMFFDANGDAHWFGIYNRVGEGNGKTQFWDVNLKTGATNYFNTGSTGRGNGTSKAISGNKFYIGINDACAIWEYDISTGSFSKKTNSSWTSGCGTSSREVGVQSTFTAQDGMVYMGTVTRGTVIEIDPSTGAIRDFGVIDPPANDPTCSTCTSSRYVANIAADSKYVYAGMRDTKTNSWWLAILNRSDGSLSASCWKDDGLGSGSVNTSLDGSQIWYNGSYRLDTTDGACPTNTGNPPSLKSWFYNSKVYNPLGDSYAQSASMFGYDIDISSITPNTNTGGLTTLKYRQSGSGSYTSKTQSIQTMNSAVRRIKAKDSRSVYLGSGTYGPNAVFNGSSSIIAGEISGQSLYDIVPAGQYVYLLGYTAITYRWDPNSAWTLSGSIGTSCNSGSPTNPCVALQGLGKYHYYGVLANNGLVYVASDYVRGSRAGGDLAWINPSSGSVGSHAFNCDAPTGIALLSDGVTIAYSGDEDAGSFGCTSTEGKLYLFNTNNNTVTSTLTPIPGAGDQGKVIGTKDGGILGVLKDYPSNNKYTVYKIDQSGKHASWSPTTINGNIFGSVGKPDQKLILSNDDMVYTWNSSGVLKINPDDGTSAQYVSLSGISYIEFAGEDLYISTGSSLRRIRGVNKASLIQKQVQNETPKEETKVEEKKVETPVPDTVIEEKKEVQKNIEKVIEEVKKEPVKDEPEVPIKQEEEKKVEQKIEKPKIIEEITNTKAVTLGDFVRTFFPRNLYYRAYGEDVKTLQTFLNVAGYSVSSRGPGSPGLETKYFGPATRRALIKFQRENRLVPDGIFGPSTSRKIRELSR